MKNFQSEANPVDKIEKAIERYFSKNRQNFTGSKDHNLTLLKGGRLGKTHNSVVYKGSNLLNTCIDSLSGDGFR